MTEGRDRQGAVAKTVRIMELLCSSEETLTIRDIESRTGIPRSTVHRFLLSLEEQEWVYMDPSSESYRPGVRFFLLQNSGNFYRELTEAADPAMAELVEKTGKTSIMSVLEGSMGLCIHTVEPPLSMKFVAHKGMAIPLDAGATGKVLLAFCRDRTRERILSSLGDFEKTAPLRREIDAIRSRGYAISREEWIKHAGDISVPVFNKEGAFLAQLGIAGLASSFDGLEDELVRLVRASADRIGRSL